MTSIIAFLIIPLLVLFHRSANADHPRGLFHCVGCLRQARLYEKLRRPVPSPPSSRYSLSVDAHDRIRPFHRVDKRYLSIAIDTAEMKRKFACFPLQSKKLLRLARALAPAYLRVGGTDQDFLTFVPDGSMNERSFAKSRPECTPRFVPWSNKTEFEVSFRTFDAVARFARLAGWRFIFGLNARKRNIDGSWNANNPMTVIAHAHARNISLDWELGNEPNRYVKYGPQAVVTPVQLAQDFQKLRQRVVSRHARVFGPDVNRPKQSSLRYVHAFLRGRPNVQAFTYHHYYLPQAHAQARDFVNPLLMDQLRLQMRSLLRVVRNASGKAERTAPIWLGETGSASGGGRPGLSDAYAGGFLFLDKLGLASLHKHVVVVRQSFYGGYYGMLDSLTRDPLPDYWTAVLFKRLVGRDVMRLRGGDAYLRAYAFCAKPSRAGMRSNRIVIVMINVNKRENATVFVRDVFPSENRVGDDGDVVQYLLTPKGGDLQSKHVLLNGKLLTLSDEGRLPALPGVRVLQPVRMPPLSYGFYVINASVNYC